MFFSFEAKMDLKRQENKIVIYNQSALFPDPPKVG